MKNLIVFVACTNREECEAIAQSIVEDHLAACVNVLPGVRSCYEWEGKLTWSEEALLLIKTTGTQYQRLEDRIRELHSYETPEIVAVPIEIGFDKYLQWIAESVKT